MAKASKEKQRARNEPSPTDIAKRKRDRAYFIRSKIKAGNRPVSDEERAWLASYDAEPNGNAKESDAAPEVTPAPGTPPTDAPPPETEAEVVARLAMEAGAAAAVIMTPSVAPPPPPRVLPPRPEGLPTPPRVLGDAPAGGRPKAGRWQDSYSYLGGGGDGREKACVYIGSLWHGGLKQMADALTDAGIEPLIKPDDLIGAIILTVDRVLPPEFALTPEVVACAGSSAIMAQRFMRRDTIKRKREEKELAARAGRPVFTPDPPPPPPPAREERAVVAPPVTPPAPPPREETPPPPIVEAKSAARPFDPGGLL